MWYNMLCKFLIATEGKLRHRRWGELHPNQMNRQDNAVVGWSRYITRSDCIYITFDVLVKIRSGKTGCNRNRKSGLMMMTQISFTVVRLICNPTIAYSNLLSRLRIGSGQIFAHTYLCRPTVEFDICVSSRVNSKTCVPCPGPWYWHRVRNLDASTVSCRKFWFVHSRLKGLLKGHERLPVYAVHCKATEFCFAWLCFALLCLTLLWPQIQEHRKLIAWFHPNPRRLSQSTNVLWAWAT